METNVTILRDQQDGVVSDINNNIATGCNM